MRKQYYLGYVCDFEKSNEKAAAVPAPREQKATLDVMKVKRLIQELCEPMIVSISARMSPPTSKPRFKVEIDYLCKVIFSLGPRVVLIKRTISFKSLYTEG